jgi:VanZ family protein
MKLKARTGWLLLGILIVVVIFSPAPGNTRWIRTLHNSAHGPIFGCIALLMLHVIRAHPRWKRLGSQLPYLLALLVSTLVGVATEIAQGFIGRDASFSDAFHDVLGAAAFLALFSLIDRQLQVRSRTIRTSMLIVGVALLAFLATPIVRSAADYRQRDQLFPVLADFSRTFDRYFISQRFTTVDHAALPPPWAATANESAMRVAFLAGTYPGIEIAEPLPDWTAYSTLVFDITNPSDLDLELVLRIDDANHNQQYSDRFNKSYRVPAHTRSVLRVPLAEVEAGPVARALDMKKVASVVLFRSESSAAPEMYFSRAWLE